MPFMPACGRARDPLIAEIASPVSSLYLLQCGRARKSKIQNGARSEKNCLARRTRPQPLN